MADNAEARRHRPAEVGKVISVAGNKTIVVEVTRRIPHRLYARFVNRRRKFHAHDETNQCHVGDQVRIVASRPLSKLKRWRLQEIVQKAKLITTASKMEKAPAVEKAS